MGGPKLRGHIHEDEPKKEKEEKVDSFKTLKEQRPEVRGLVITSTGRKWAGNGETQHSLYIVAEMNEMKIEALRPSYVASRPEQSKTPKRQVSIFFLSFIRPRT